MWLRLAAFAALVLAPCVAVRAQAPLPPGSSEILTLDAAFDRVAQAHPGVQPRYV